MPPAPRLLGLFPVLVVLLAAAPARAEEPMQLANSLSVGGGVHLWGVVVEAGQEVMSRDYSLSFDVFFGHSDRVTGDDRTRSDVLGLDVLVRFHYFAGERVALYAGGGALLALDAWRWRDRTSPALRHGLSFGPGLALAAGVKVRVVGDVYVDLYVKAGVAGGLESGGRLAGAPGAMVGLRVGFWLPVAAARS